MKDLVVKCNETYCGKTFVVTAADQKYLKGRCWNLPRKCWSCRFNKRPLNGGMYHPLGGERQKQAV